LAAETFVDTLKRVTSGGHIPRGEARRTVRAMCEEDVGDALIAGLLVALKMKGESAQEIAGFAEGMRASETVVCDWRMLRVIHSGLPVGARRQGPGDDQEGAAPCHAGWLRCSAACETGAPHW
jgi:hypothetical protein